ncbi:hypothetical protein ID866_1760 [Astraeus odoratus]|nr:hypothetical protein ID866_1760 [Astraeus odoratus]
MSGATPALAFLGPVGTFTHQAAYDCFGTSVKYIPQHTIADVFESLSPCLPIGVVPQENSTNGSVVETYNFLRTSSVGQSIFIRGHTVLAIQHCLIVRHGVKLEDIEHVLSHEQALGQCRSFLAEHLPRASLVPTDSTASAAETISTGSGSLDPSKCAAICSSIVVTIFEGLEVLQEGIQGGKGNSTRFFIVTHGSNTTLPLSCELPVQKQALLRVSAPLVEATAEQASTGVNLRKVINAFELDVLRIDRRPALCAPTFQDIYFFEIEDTEKNDDLTWAKKVLQVVKRVKCVGVEVSLLGHW